MGLGLRLETWWLTARLVLPVGFDRVLPVGFGFTAWWWLTAWAWAWVHGVVVVDGGL
uniref:Uncharacterized protein n=1 Tax=Fagus sylvatica TaxID=28930 RepID=A0A2N9IRQ5_FAGSY